MNCKFICLLALLLVLSHSPAGTTEEDKKENRDISLDGLGFKLLELLSNKSNKERANFMNKLQDMLNVYAPDTVADAGTPKPVSVDKAQGEVAVNNISNTTTTTPKETTTTPKEITTTTTTIQITKTPIATTAANASTIPPVDTATAPTLATQQQTENVDPTIIPTTTARTAKVEIQDDTPKSPVRTSPMEEHFYKSPFFFFLLFCSVISLFTVYFLYVSRRKLKTYFYKNFAPGRGGKAAYTRAPTLEDAMPSFSGVKQ